MLLPFVDTVLLISATCPKLNVTGTHRNLSGAWLSVPDTYSAQPQHFFSMIQGLLCFAGCSNKAGQGVVGETAHIEKHTDT